VAEKTQRGIALLEDACTVQFSYGIGQLRFVMMFGDYKVVVPE
jgi:hypothetical protein